MKYLIGLSLLVFLSISVYTQNLELSHKLIQQYEIGQSKALSKDVTTRNGMWLTPILTEVAVNWEYLTEEAKDLFKVYRNRPVFAGTVLTVSNGYFKFHYTLDAGAGESVDPTDENANDIPDYVEMMSSKFNEMYLLYHTTTGLSISPNDGVNGGDEMYDIYISGDAAGAGVYGWVMPETEIGDNPNSLNLIETDAYSSFMVMRNNYLGFGDENVALSVTAAHEYMHAIQNGYAVSMDSWFKEICATWSEEFAFPGYDDNFQYLMDLFGKPDVALNLADGETSENDGHWYSSWVFAKYLTEQTGNEIVKNIYERCLTQWATDAIDNELSANWSSSLETIFVQFAIANVLMTDNVNFVPYTYNRATDYDAYRTNNGGFVFENNASPINYSGTPITWDSQSDGNNRLMRLSSDYFSFSTDRNFKVTLNANTTQARLVIVKSNTNSFSIAMCDANESINVSDHSDWDLFIPIVVRFDKDAQDANALDYTLSFDDAITGIDEISSSISISPNPTSDFLNVNVGNLNKFDFSIIDITGKIITRQKSNNQYCKIDVRNVNNGIYFLQIMYNNEVVKTEKIVISH